MSPLRILLVEDHLDTARIMARVLTAEGHHVKTAHTAPRALELARRYPGVGDSLFGPDGRLRQFVNVYLNDEDIRYLGQLETTVENGDTISILPAVAGGA